MPPALAMVHDRMAAQEWLRAARRGGREIFADNVPWLVYELPPAPFDRRSTPSLVFDTGGTTNPPPVNSNGHDWPRFGFDEARTSAFDAPTGITAAIVPTMKRQQVAIEGVVDASAIYLHNIQVSGVAHDVFFVTTLYGKTIAVDANDGSILWTYTPTSYSTWAGSARITNVTPVADPDRTAIYTASPDGHVEKLAVSDG